MALITRIAVVSEYDLLPYEPQRGHFELCFINFYKM